MTRETEVRASVAQPRVEIVHVGGVGVRKRQPVAHEAQIFQRCLKNSQRAGIFGRHAGTADQVTC